MLNALCVLFKKYLSTSIVFLEAIFDLSYLDPASRIYFMHGNKVLNIFPYGYLTDPATFVVPLVFS